MPNAWVGWIPGFMFGIGTMIMQIILGAGFGRWLSGAKKLTQRGIAFVARTISSDVLYYGGLAFAIAGIAILAYPQILTYGISTGIKIHNLGNLGIGFFIVVFVVIAIGLLSYFRAIRIASRTSGLHISSK